MKVQRSGRRPLHHLHFRVAASSGHRPTTSGTRGVLRMDHPTSRGSNHDCTSDSYGGKGGIRSSDGNAHRPTSLDHHSHIAGPPPERWWPERSQSLLPVRFFSSYVSIPYGRGMAPNGPLAQKTTGEAACSLGCARKSDNRKRTEQSASLRRPEACWRSPPDNAARLQRRGRMQKFSRISGLETIAISLRAMGAEAQRHD